jgi:hypothetical protein
MGIRRSFEYAVLGFVFVASSYEAAISSTLAMLWGSLAVAATTAALVAGLYWAHNHSQEYPEWMKPGAERQLYFAAFVIVTGIISSVVYYLTTPQRTLETATSEVLVGFFFTVFAWGSLSAYRKERRRLTELGEGAGPMPSYSIIPYSWSRYLFISLMAVTGGLAVIYTMGLASYFYPANTLVVFMKNSNSNLVLLPYTLAAAIGGFAGYRISKARWMVEGMFVWLVGWGFWMGSLFGLLGAQQANLFHDTGRTAELVNVACVAVGIAAGYALTKTEWYDDWKTRFLFNNGVIGGGTKSVSASGMQELMSAESAAHRALQSLSPKDAAALYDALEGKKISELTDLEFAERLELAESPSNGVRKQVKTHNTK